MTYFRRLKKYNRQAYFSVCIFFGLSLLLMLINLQVSPFFVWNMYSVKEVRQPHEPYITYKLWYNGKPFDLPIWQDHWRMHYTYTIPKFDALQENGGIDPFAAKLRLYKVPELIAQQLVNNVQSEKKYPEWLRGYLSEVTGEPVHNLVVAKYWLSYQANEKLSEDSSAVIISIK